MDKHMQQLSITDWENRLCSLWGMALCSEDINIGFTLLSQQLYGAFTFEADKERSDTLNFLIYIADDIISQTNQQNKNSKGCPKTPFRDVKTSPWAVNGSSACTAPQL